MLLDISGSVSQNAVSGHSVHDQQRRVAATLATVLYEVGDRVALYAFNRSEEHTSELQSLMRISYAVFCLKKKKKIHHTHNYKHISHNNHNQKSNIYYKRRK